MSVNNSNGSSKLLPILIAVTSALISGLITSFGFTLYFSQTSISRPEVEEIVDQRIAPISVQISENEKRSLVNDELISLLRERQDELRIIVTRLEANQEDLENDQNNLENLGGRKN